MKKKVSIRRLKLAKNTISSLSSPKGGNVNTLPVCQTSGDFRCQTTTDFRCCVICDL
ncbi:hypothetical protein [Ascidiimonas aurantiaca]|uniref:hypothetical protein n=1 Tax=Ascidiimonas aurantiaca TaxID=1685432 RepID=UPI0030EC603F